MPRAEITDLPCRTTAELDTALDRIASAPKDTGTLTMVVARPAEGERHVLAEGELDLTCLGARSGCGMLGASQHAR